MSAPFAMAERRPVAVVRRCGAETSQEILKVHDHTIEGTGLGRRSGGAPTPSGEPFMPVIDGSA